MSPHFATSALNMASACVCAPAIGSIGTGAAEAHGDNAPKLTLVAPAHASPAVGDLGEGKDSGLRQAFINQADAPPCPDCGCIMVRNGACYKCMNCGTTSGCS